MHSDNKVRGGHQEAMGPGVLMSRCWGCGARAAAARSGSDEHMQQHVSYDILVARVGEQRTSRNMHEMIRMLIIFSDLEPLAARDDATTTLRRALKWECMLAAIRSCGPCNTAMQLTASFR